jgi:hypothetical protein
MSRNQGRSTPVVTGAEKMLYDRKSAAFALSLSARTVDYALARGEFETRKNGRKTLITAASLKRYAASNHFGPVDVNKERKAA